MVLIKVNGLIPSNERMVLIKEDDMIPSIGIDQRKWFDFIEWKNGINQRE